MNLNRKLTLSAARPSQLIVIAICLVFIVLNSCGHSGSDFQKSDLQAKEGADKFCALMKSYFSSKTIFRPGLSFKTESSEQSLSCNARTGVAKIVQGTGIGNETIFEFTHFANQLQVSTKAPGEKGFTGQSSVEIFDQKMIFHPNVKDRTSADECGMSPFAPWEGQKKAFCEDEISITISKNNSGKVSGSVNTKQEFFLEDSPTTVARTRKLEILMWSTDANEMRVGLKGGLGIIYNTLSSALKPWFFKNPNGR